MEPPVYRGRLAPTPTGYLHLGHARSFHCAWQRARAHHGQLILRIEDLDPDRCKPAYTDALLEDLRWMGIDWDEGPLFQSQRRAHYLAAWQTLKDGGWIYPCTRSRQDLRNAALAPHEEDEAAEALYPPAWRPPASAAQAYGRPDGVVWRFRLSEGRVVTFSDHRKGLCRFTAGVDFGDFVVWRRDNVPAYELAVVVDDLAMGITEVVRGEDLLRSTARQILLYEALGGTPPAWCHLPLVRDASGRRLAKRHDALSLRTLRAQGRTFADCLAELGMG